MATKIGIGFSQHLDPATAARSAAFESKTNLNENKVDFALIFFSTHYIPSNFMPIISKILSGVKLIGVSAAGLIIPTAVQTRGIAVLTITSDEIKFGVGSIPNIDHQQERNAGAIFARSSVFNIGNQKRQALVFFYDNLLNITNPFIYGIQEVLGNAFPLVAIGSCDNFQFKQSFQIYNETMLQKSCVGILFGGNATIGISSRHGLKPLGKPRFVDKATTNIIYSIDGKKAFSLYEEFFGTDAQTMRSKRFSPMSVSYPMGILSDINKNYLIRNAIDILDDGSILCQGEVPIGSEIHLMISSRDMARQAAVEATKSALAQLQEGQSPKLILVLESMARLKLLGRSAFDVIRDIRSVVPAQTPIFGMYGHGEIVPYASSEQMLKTYIQNESIIVIAVS